ncbi:MAG: hypothetical protein WBD50_01735 [Candidatus Rhabdochlamydia sp.]
MAAPIGFGYTHIFRISSAPSARPQLSAEEEQYVQELVSIKPLNSILTDKNVREKCKSLGQKVFDQAKVAHNEDSFAAKDVVVRICNAICFSCNDGSLRKQYIERAWDGIGDDVWRWMA